MTLRFLLAQKLVLEFLRPRQLPVSCPHFPYISFYRGLDNLRRLHLRKFRGATHVPVPHPLAYDRLIIAVAKLHGPAVSSQLRSHQPQ